MTNIGFPCLAIGVEHSNYKTIRKEYLTDEKLKEIISYNLDSLENIIDYNIKNNIKMFRISSDLIPFGSSPINKLNWDIIFQDKFKSIAKKIKKGNIRVSMHPGQYTVLNSPDKEIVNRAIDDLNYHGKILELLETDFSSKLILHIGGVYGDKVIASNRFVENFSKLNDNIKKRLVIENDDRSFNIVDVLKISEQINIPVIFDNLHHEINPPDIYKTDQEWINLCKLTFKIEDGRQKIHYSEQDVSKKMGAHSKTINPDKFLIWYKAINREDIDIMLEVKDKNISAIKISDCLNSNIKISKLENSWAKYKYSILEYSPQTYFLIRELLKDKVNINPLLFYKMIDDALDSEISLNNQINALDHVWGYFKSNINQKHLYLLKLDRAKKGSLSVSSIKKYLHKLALKAENKYLLESYYFSI
ncbi:MAG: UV DNA damage repair endonuclease UvsE [Acholeplasma sp.]|nr:UV DNA damage repair endonuclease UvsE [Acholeplasma sp.]